MFGGKLLKIDPAGPSSATGMQVLHGELARRLHELVDGVGLLSPILRAGDVDGDAAARVVCLENILGGLESLLQYSKCCTDVEPAWPVERKSASKVWSKDEQERGSVLGNFFFLVNARRPTPSGEIESGRQRRKCLGETHL